MRPSAFRSASPLLALVFSACGGTAVVEQGSGGAGSAASTTAATSTTGTTTTATSSSTGGGPCTSHADCPGAVCVFATGLCAAACGDATCGTCGPGSTCEPCATASCPDCLDCLGACVPLVDGRCDDDDPCPDGGTCLWYARTCAPSCATDTDCDGFSFCDPCASSSCCNCDNCAGACVGGE